MKEGVVSFLIVAHNAGDFLADAVASVFAQTYAACEVVLVDNASTDGSVDAVVLRWAAHPGFRCVRAASNLGPAGGAWLGLPHCSGEFLARLDADDITLPQRAALQVAWLQANPQWEAVGADVLCVSSDGEALYSRQALRTAFLRRYGARWEAACPHSTLMVRRTAANRSFYNRTLFVSEDYEWLDRLARKGQLGIVPQELAWYRLHSGSIGASLPALQRVSGYELRRLASATGFSPEAREALATQDFSAFTRDPRLQLGAVELADLFRRECLKDGNFLAAAYFTTVSRRWWEFPWRLVQAIGAGQGGKPVLGLLLVRTAWPAWKRLYRLASRLSRGLTGSRKRTQAKTM